ncbi:MAG: hypothetical protein J4G09_03340 [Proteobacteria bacterium]|nr:hypothetical protein [Pseudomonadota bacterium]
MSEIGSLITPKDAKFHRPAFAESTWAETNWFSFLIPEIPLRGHMWNMFRTNLGVARSNVFVFGGSSARGILGWEFARDDVHLTYEGNLDDYRLSNGLQVKMTKPLQEWRIRYDSGVDTHWELVAEALMPPVATQEIRCEGSGPGYTVFHRTDAGAPLEIGHIDQTFNMTGKVTVNGRSYDVDFPSAHDHSWSPRREFGHNVMGNFDDAHFGRELTISVQTRNDRPDQGIVTNGYVLDGRELVAVKHGRGRFRMHNYLTRAIDYELEDTRGKTWNLSGEVIAQVDSVSVNAYTTTSIVRWSLGGETGWGESKWHWDVQKMQAAIRERRFGWDLPG